MNNTRAALASSQAVSPESIFMFLPTGYDAHTVRCGQESVAAVSPPGLAGFTDVNKGGGSLRLVVGALPRAGRHSTTAARGRAPTTSRNEPPPLFTSVKPARPGGETAATDSCPQRTVCALSLIHISEPTRPY